MESTWTQHGTKKESDQNKLGINIESTFNRLGINSGLNDDLESYPK